MYVRDINTLPDLGNEIVYIDEITREERSGIVMYVERVSDKLAFVYVASPDKKENDKWEGSINYRDIITFDDKPININGWNRDTVMGEYGKYIGIDIEKSNS